MSVKQAYLDLVAVLDCGDNSCRYKKSGGMRTNGGCTCLEYPTRQQLLMLRRLMNELKNEHGE